MRHFVIVGILVIAVATLTYIGLDAAGEWAEYDVPVAAFGHYTFLFKCRGDFGVGYNFQLIFSLESGAKETVNFSFVGMGYG